MNQRNSFSSKACRVVSLVVALLLALQANVAFASGHGAAKSKKKEAPKSEHGKSEHAKSEPEKGGHGESEGGHGGGHGEAEGEHGAPADDSNSNGVKLGEFRIRTDYPVEAQKCTLRFTFYATAKPEQLEALRHTVELHQQKVRDIIITATRLAPLTVFEEPNLATFRRRVLLRLRRTIPELTFDELYVSEFGLIVRTL